MRVGAQKPPSPDCNDPGILKTTTSSRVDGRAGPRTDLLDELRQRVRANHRLRWELAQSRHAGAPSGSASNDYVEMTEAEVIRAVDSLIAAMEQQQVDSYYASIETQDYEDYLASEFGDGVEVLVPGR